MLDKELQSALEHLLELSEDDAAEVIAQWAAATGRNLKPIEDRADAIAEGADDL